MKAKENVLIRIRRTSVKLQCEYFLNVSEVQQFFGIFSLGLRSASPSIPAVCPHWVTCSRLIMV